MFNNIQQNSLINLFVKHSQNVTKRGDGCDVLVWVFLQRVYDWTFIEAYKTTVMNSSFHLSSVLECKVLKSGVREELIQLFIAGTSSMPEIEQAFNKPLLKEWMS